MDNYLGKFQTMKDVRNELYKIYNVNSQAKLAEKLDMAKATISRLFTLDYAGGRGPKRSNVEIIVEAIAKHNKADKNEVRNKIYELVYSPDIVEENLLKQDIELSEEKLDDNSEAVLAEEIETKATVEEADLVDISENGFNILNKMKETIFELTKECNLVIEECRVSKKIDNAIIVDVIPEYNSIYMGGYIGMIYGMYLTEENYFSLIHDVAELNTKDGMIILFYTEENIFNKAWDDEKLKVNNNVLLYCLSRKRKIYVKSVRKKQKAFLKNLFGKERLLF